MHFFISDVAATNYNSTQKLVLDLIKEIEVNEKSSKTYYFIIVKNGTGGIEQASKNVCVQEVFVPFYKSKSLLLRFLSDFYFSAASFTVLVQLLSKHRRGYRSLAVVSPNIFSSLTIFLAKQIGLQNIFLIQRDLFHITLTKTDSKLLKAFHPVFNLLMWIGVKFASRVGFESEEDFKLVSNQYPKFSNKFEVLNNWYEFKKLPANCLRFGSETKFIYAGTIGRLQGPNAFITVFGALGELGYVVNVFGKGTDYNNVNNKIKQKKIETIRFHGEITQEAIQKKVQNHNFGFVFLDPNFPVNNIPGKMMLYFSSGLPVIAVCNSKSYLCEFLSENKLGHVITEYDLENPVQLKKKLKDIIENNKLDRTDIYNKAKLLFSVSNAKQSIFLEAPKNFK